MQSCKVEAFKATGKLRQRQPKKTFCSRVSEATLGTFSGHFWNVLAAKLGGVSAQAQHQQQQAHQQQQQQQAQQSCCTLQSCKVEDFRATGKLCQRQPKKCFFSRVSEATLGSFSGHFWDVLGLGAKLGGVSEFRVVSISRAVARCKVARKKLSKRQESYAPGSQKRRFSRVSEATLGSFSDHSWAALGAKVKVSAFRVVSISRVVARWKVARLKPSKQQESFGMFWALN